MDIIKLQKIDGRSSFYFFDAGDIKIFPSAQWSDITIKNKEDIALFEMEMNPAYAIMFGAVYVRPLCKEFIELPTGVKFEDVLKDTACFDPRVVAYVIFMESLHSLVFKNGEKTKDITLPILSFDEAKDFLRKNNLLREDIYSEWEPNPPKELIDIPEKVQALFE